MKGLVLCGGLPQAYLIEEMKKRGITALLVDQDEKAPAVKYADKFYTVSVFDIDGIREVAKREKVNFIISVCADQVLLVAAQLCEELGLPCYIDYETAKNVSSKEYMKQIFVEYNIPTPRYIVCDKLTLDNVKNLCFPLVVKPVDSYSSRGVKKVHNMDELYAAFENAINISRTKTAIIEEFATGDELSIDIYVENGVVNILSISILDKIPESDGFVICRGIYPATLSIEMFNRIQDVAQRIADAFKLFNTPMLVQMKIDGEKINVIEFCARTGGGMKYRLIPIVSGFDVVNAVLDLTLGQKPHLAINKYQGYILDEYLYCKPGILDHLEGFDGLLKDGIISHYEQFKSSGYEFTKISSSGDRVAYFSIQAESYEELKRKYRIAGEKVKAISITGEDLIRHDFITLK